MPLLVPNTMHLRHQMLWSTLPRPMEVTYGVRAVNMEDYQDAADVADALFLAFNDNFQAGMSDQVTLGDVLWTAQLTDGTEVQGVAQGGTLGADSDDVPPPAMGMRVKKNTGLAGRRFRGSLTIPGYLDESNVNDNGRLAPATITSSNATLADWLADIQAITTTNVTATDMVVLHGTEPATPVGVVTSLTVDPVLGVQRRRMQRS